MDQEKSLKDYNGHLCIVRRDIKQIFHFWFLQIAETKKLRHMSYDVINHIQINKEGIISVL